MRIYFEHTELEEKVALETAVTAGSVIVLFNDDVNTFDHVVDCLIKYCKHTPEQAEQCSLLVHYKGKCTVKHGLAEELGPICDALCLKGLSATVEES